jgi:hypothetical protein
MKKRLLLAVTASLVLGGAVRAIALEPVGGPDASGPPAACPNPYGGGPCLGELTGGTYRTTVFEPPLTITVPEGWTNLEDLPDSFLLLPSGGIIDALGDSISVKRGVAVSDATCQERPEPDVGISAEAMAAELAGRDGLLVSEPMPVEVGGLSGLMIDIAYDVESGAGCQYEGYPVTLVPLIMDIDPGGFVHTQEGDDYTTRLYLLDHGDTNIVIEVQDVPDSSGTTDEYATIIDSIEFATASS